MRTPNCSDAKSTVQLIYQTESAERWSDPNLKRQAKGRIDCYVPASRTFDEKLASCMHAFLEWAGRRKGMGRKRHTRLYE